MGLANPKTVLEHTGFPQELVEKLYPHIKKAERRLRSLIGDNMYEDLKTRQPADPDRQRAVHAESLLSVYFAFPFWNLRPTTRGGFVLATGVDQSRNELMGKRQMEQYRKSIYQQALELIDDLIVQDEDGEDLEGPINFISV